MELAGPSVYNGRMSAFRIVCSLFLLISVCAFPLFFTIGVGLFSIIWFKNYYEAIPLAFLSDVLYGAPLHHFFSFQYVLTLIAAVLVLASAIVRAQMFDTTMQRI